MQYSPADVCEVAETSSRGAEQLKAPAHTVLIVLSLNVGMDRRKAEEEQMAWGGV